MTDYTMWPRFYSVFGSDTDFYEEALDKAADVTALLKVNQELRAEVYRLKAKIDATINNGPLNQKERNELNELRVANKELQAENRTLSKACEYWSGKHKAVRQQLVGISEIINLKA